MGFLLAHAIDRRADAEPTADAGGQELAVTTQQMPYEAVRDFFCAQRNHFDNAGSCSGSAGNESGFNPYISASR